MIFSISGSRVTSPLPSWSIDLDVTDVSGILWVGVRTSPLRVSPCPGPAAASSARAGATTTDRLPGPEFARTSRPLVDAAQHGDGPTRVRRSAHVTLRAIYEQASPRRNFCDTADSADQVGHRVEGFQLTPLDRLASATALVGEAAWKQRMKEMK